VDTGHAQYLGKWYCPITMSDVTADQWKAMQKAMRISRQQQEQQQLEQQ